MRVLAAFGLTAALAVAVAAVSLAYNTDAGRGLARVTERDRAVSADFRTLEGAVEQQSGAVQNFLLSGEDRYLDTLIAARQRFNAALQRLERSLPREERGAALAELRRQAEDFDDIAAQEIALYRQGWGRNANFLWQTDGIQTKQRLLVAVQRQVEAHDAAIDQEIRRSRGHLRFAYGVSLGLVTVAALFAFVVGMRITRAVTGPVRDLMRVAAAVRGGDYSVRVPVTGEDELAVLSQSMNTMVESLAESRARLEQALAETERSKARYRLLTENATDIIFALDRQNHITFINPAVRQTLGYEPAELIGRPAALIYTEATRELMAAQAGWVTREPRSFTADIELVAKDGRVVPLEVRSSVLMVDGKAVGVHGIARDMTERHRMEQELRRLHAQGQRRVDQLVTLNEVGRKIAALQPLDTLLPSLAKTFGRTFGYHHVRILLLNDEDQLTTAAAWHQQETNGTTTMPAPGGGSSAAPDSPTPAPHDTVAQAVNGAGAVSGTAGLPLHAGDGSKGPAGDEADWDSSDSDDAGVSPLALRALDGDAGFVAGSGRPEDDAGTRYTEVAVPVRTKSGVLGVLDVRGGADEPLDESDIFTLQTLADQIAVAIENARLYEAGRRLAVSEERNRLARELHDSVTQELFSMTMMAGALPTLIERKPEAARERAQRLYELARGALTEMRALLFALRPAALGEEGLISALTKHAAAFESREGVTVHLDIEGDGRLPQPCEEALYRIAQEALNNVAKHARAKTVWLTLSIGVEQTSLTVRDDGVGLGAATTPSGGRTMGMASMRERVEALGGRFAVESAPGAGTTVHVTVPIGLAECVSA